MKVKCEHCGAEISDLDVKCPYCRGENIYYKKEIVSTYNDNTVPRTIEELKQWYIDMNLPDEIVTRFFIGKNYKHPKAFGIYKDEKTENFIVYKNKGNGERAIRYNGKDEAYAVNELYKKLKDEIYNQKHNNNGSENKKRSIDDILISNLSRKKTVLITILVITIYFSIIGIIAYISSIFPNRGYYRYNNDYYYYQSGRWYGYDDYSGWYHTSVDDNLKKNYSDYYLKDYDYSYDTSRFEDSSYYVEPSSSYDSDSSWSSSDSWDSGSTDWDSDW